MKVAVYCRVGSKEQLGDADLSTIFDTNEKENVEEREDCADEE